MNAVPVPFEKYSDQYCTVYIMFGPRSTQIPSVQYILDKTPHVIQVCEFLVHIQYNLPDKLRPVPNPTPHSYEESGIRTMVRKGP